MLSRKFEINNYNTDKYSLKSKNVTVTYTTMLPTCHVMLLHDSYRTYGDSSDSRIGVVIHPHAVPHHHARDPLLCEELSGGRPLEQRSRELGL